MIGGFILLVVLYFVNDLLLSSLKGSYKYVRVGMLKNLFSFHYVFAIIYYTYAQFNNSDSVGYFQYASVTTFSWLELYAPGTDFIRFVTFFFVRYLSFSYEMMMVLFAYMGYWGFVFFYIFFRENIQFKHNWQGYDLLTILLFLPNMHFWTVSLGKGSIIFLGLGMVAFALSRIGSRKIPMVIGLFIVYLVRPHVFMFVCVGILLGLFSGRAKVSVLQKSLVFVAAGIAMAFLYNKILAFAMLDSENVVQSFENFSSVRGAGLAKAGSGVNVANYPLPLKLLTFWFRPLFVDAPGVLGLIISFENLFYVILTLKLFKMDFIRFIINGSTLVKSSLVIFISSSIALSFVMTNLGIIMRQKSMVMYFFFFIIVAFLDYQKMSAFRRRSAREKLLGATPLSVSPQLQKT